MLAASAFGTNVGDLWAEVLFPGRIASLASLLCICVAAVWYHRRAAARTEAGYWVAIVAMRAAATNLADILTHELALGYVLASVLIRVWPSECVCHAVRPPGSKVTNAGGLRGRIERVDAQGSREIVGGSFAGCLRANAFDFHAALLGVGFDGPSLAALAWGVI